MSPAVETLQASVRTNSKEAWNEWVGSARARELAAWIIAGACAGVALMCTIGWWQAAHQPVLPPVVITTDAQGQVLDLKRPRELPRYRDVDLKHYLAQYVSDVFSVYDSADVLAMQYERARMFMLPGSQAWLGVQRHWDRYSPLRKFPDGTLRMPNPPERKVEVSVPSFLPRGKTADGAEIYDLSWSETATSLKDASDAITQRYTARAEFVRSYDAGAADADRFYIANPYGLRLRFFTWDYQR
jgi:type IV secretory pathway TrbF-like protein